MRLSKFCCTSLKKGTIFIGSMSVVSSVLSVISMITEFKELPQSNGVEILVRMIGFVVLVFVTGVGVLAGLMIYGAHTRNPELIFPWLALSTSKLLLAISVVLGFIAIAPTLVPIGYFIGYIAVIAIFLALHTYIWLAVYSFYLELISEKYAIGIAPECGKVVMYPPTSMSYVV